MTSDSPSEPAELPVAWSGRIRIRLYLAFGAILMVPFGTLIAAGVLAGLLSAPSNLAEAYRAGPGDLALATAALLLTLAFGVFLTYALLRHGLSSLYDVLTPGRVVEGVVTAKRVVHGRRGIAQRWIDVGSESFDCSATPFELVRVGTHVRARFGRFEKNLEVLQLRRARKTTDPSADR